MDDLGWMIGTWVASEADETTVERWLCPHPGILLGEAKTTRSGKQVFSEHLQISRDGDTLVYFAWPEGQAMTKFSMTEIGVDRAVFENPAHDWPTRVEYRRHAESLTARVSGATGGEEKEASWVFVRSENETQPRSIEKRVVVSASAKEIFDAWTTEEGTRSFFSEDSRVEARPGGLYEMLFDTEQAEGSRGSEQCVVVEVVPGKRLVFTWSFPPSLPSIRNAHTVVVVDLVEFEERKTEVRLRQMGFHAGEDWDKGLAYFDRAWDVVLDRLQTRFVNGPIDWSAQ